MTGDDDLVAVDLPTSRLRLRVVAGEATLFLASLDDSGRPRARTPVATQSAPGLVVTPEAPPGWTWVVAPGMDGRVVPLDPAVDEPAVRTAIEPTVATLGDRLRGWAPLPASRVVRIEGARTEVPADHGAVAEECVWVEVTSGSLSLEATTSGWEGAPLPPRLTLVAGSDAVATATALRDVPVARLVDGLEWLYGVLVAETIAREADRRLADRDRVESFEETSRAAELAGVQVLAEQLRTRPRPSVPRTGDDLVAAMGLVLATQGLQVVAPRGGSQGLEGAAAVRTLAASSGVFHRRVDLTGPWWRVAADPVLGFRTDGTPLALIPTRRGYDVVEPGGTERPVDATYAADVVDAGFVFSRPIVRGRLDVPTLGRAAVARRRTLILGFLGWAVAIGLAGLAVPFASGVVFDQIVPAEDTRRLGFLFGVLIVVALATIPLQLAMVSPLTRFETSASLDLQRGLWGRVLLSPVTLVRRVGAGDLTMRLAALETMRDPIEKTILLALPSLISGAMAAAVLFFYDAALAAVVLAISAVLLGVAVGLAFAAGRAQEEVEEATGEVNGFLFQVLGAIPKLRVAAAESRAFLAWATRFAGAVGQRMLRAGGRQILLATLLPTLGALSLIGGVTLLGASKISPDTFLAFQTTYNLFLAGVTALITAVGTGVQSAPTLGRAVELTADEPESSHGSLEGSTLRGGVALTDVVFRYVEHSRPVLDGVSFRVEPGEFVAVTGRSGSGKSTIFRLLLGFETPELGSVLYDERHLSSLDVTALRRQLGVVLQEGHLMPGTVRQNLAGMAPVTDDEAWELARLVALDDDIRGMPMKMDTVVSLNGGAFSGGQRQRMLIARALATRPRILLLDEATSALDNVSQRVITHNLAELGMTRIVVAHRLSTIVEADRIVVVDDGRVVEEGTYDDLMERGGRFHSLATRQLV